MGCGCGQKNNKLRFNKGDNILGSYKYLNDRQIKARLEVYKKINCKNCNERYKCDYVMYLKCRENMKKS